MPSPLLERLALEFPGVLVLVILVVVFVFVIGPVPAADDLELQAEQRADRRFDGAHLERAQQQHINKLKLVHLAWRVRVDQQRNVRRSFGELSAALMLNAGLARYANFKRPP